VRREVMGEGEERRRGIDCWRVSRAFSATARTKLATANRQARSAYVIGHLLTLRGRLIVFVGRIFGGLFHLSMNLHHGVHDDLGFGRRRRDTVRMRTIGVPQASELEVVEAFTWLQLTPVVVTPRVAGIDDTWPACVYGLAPLAGPILAAEITSHHCRHIVTAAFLALHSIPVATMVDASLMPKLTTAAALARYLGVSSQTVRMWIQRGDLVAYQAPNRHYADDRPRRTKRAEWRIRQEDLVSFFARFRCSAHPNRWSQAGGS